MDDRKGRTEFTLKALDYASVFASTVGKVRISPGGYKPELIAPDGPSTAGGKQALQHIRLVPSEAGLPTLVVGSANGKTSTAELRTLAHVDANYRQRFKRAL